jgi:hypothetical protein
MRIRSIAVVLTSAVILSGCDALRSAFTAHTDVAARAENHELSVNRLSDLLGNSTLQIPVNRETAMLVTEIWVGYQLLGVAAARGDSLLDPKLVDEATLGITSNLKLRRFMESVSKAFKADSASEATYNQAAGGLFAARHILFPIAGGATQAQKDSVRRKAEGIRVQLTPANFSAMAKRYSGDPGSAQRGGDLGVFRREEMVKPFSDAVAALRPGQISPLVETQFGFHVIQRPTYVSAKTEYDAAFTQGGTQRAESVYVAKLDQDAKIEVRSNAATAAKSAARELAAHRNDNDVLASYRGGDLSVGRFVRWVESFPEQNRIPQQMIQAPDSLVRQFIKSIARNEVMLKKADSAGITLTAEEKQQMRAEFRNLVMSLWQQLGIDPKMLADSAKSVPERERLAAARVDSYLERVMSGQAQPIRVPLPVQTVLTSRYKSKTYAAGVDRAVERAKKLRASADSARTAQQPRSQVPLPMPPADTAGRRDTAPRGKRP